MKYHRKVFKDLSEDVPILLENRELEMIGGTSLIAIGPDRLRKSDGRTYMNILSKNQSPLQLDRILTGQMVLLTIYKKFHRFSV
jgi:hypothetical protein